jgi:hypothetical protein
VNPTGAMTITMAIRITIVRLETMRPGDHGIAEGNCGQIMILKSERG